MDQQTQDRLRIAYDIRARDIDAAARLRARSASFDHQPRSIRRSLGRSIISIGERIAAEPLQPARSR